MRLLAAAFATVALAAPPHAARAGDPPPPNPLRGADVKALVERAAQLEEKDARALGAALTALGDPVPDRGADLPFLVEYATQETARALRLLAADAARRIDAPAASAAFLEKAKSEKDVTRICLALECLSYTGGKEHSAAVADLVRHPSELVACAAADAFARFGGTAKETDAVIDAGLVHRESHVTDHTAWAVRDNVKKAKMAHAPYERIAKKKSDPRAVRATATLAFLEDEDKQGEGHDWTLPFDAARKALAAAPVTISVNAPNDELRAKVAAGVAWLREKMPAQHWLLCAAATKINAPGKTSDSRPDFEERAIDLSAVDASLPPNKIAFSLVRLSTVLWRKQIGEPWRGHRGWEPAIFDSYDLCVIGKLYDAGPGGLSRERFVSDQVSKRPWGGL